MTVSPLGPTGPDGPLDRASADGAERRIRPGLRGSTSLDKVTALVAEALGCPACQVSLLGAEQTAVAGTGLAPGELGSTRPLEDSLCLVAAASGAPLRVPDALADARVAGMAPVVTGEIGSYLGVPLTAAGGLVVGALCAFSPARRDWSDRDVAVIQRAADAVVAVLELAVLGAGEEDDQVLGRLTMDAAGMGTFDCDLRTGALDVDDRMLELFGYAPGGPDRGVEALVARVDPSDLPALEAALRRAVVSCGDYEVDYRVVRADDDVRWVTSRGRALADASGAAVRLLGAAYDTTRAGDGQTRLTRVLGSMSAGFVSLDRAGRVTYANAEAERLVGRARDEVVGGALGELFPAAAASEVEARCRQAVGTGRPVTFQVHCPAPLDVWLELRATPGRDGPSLYFYDVTDRRAAEERSGRTASRTALLTEVGAGLTGTLDAREAALRLAQLVVPALADGCVVTVVDDERGDWRRRLGETGSWHADPARRAALERYAQVRVGALTDGSAVARALLTGQPVVTRPGDGSPEALRPGEARELLDGLALGPSAVFPLRGRGRTVGLLSVLTGPDGGGPDGGADRLDDDDLETLADVADRAGLALDNVRLYSQQRGIAEGLQRSLLTSPPARTAVQVAVRYEPAAEVAQVGGDWYDAFAQRDGTTVLVIGDVVGHDTAAAAAMGQVRSLLRGIAAHTGAGPAEVLTGVDQVLETLQVGTAATAVVACLEPTDDQRARGASCLRWSNAGHPPPMVLHADGTAEALWAPESNLLLGIDPSRPRADSEVDLEPGATVLLYTDGLVERRGQALDQGLELLRATLEGLAGAGLGLDELCDQVIALMRPARLDDDVALVAVRLHPPLGAPAT